MSEQNPVQSVERTFLIIEQLCKSGASGITELSIATGLHKTTVFRLLSTLCSLGFVSKNPATEKYALTLKFLRLSSELLTKADIRRYARPFLEQLPQLTGETVHLVERNGTDIVYIDKFDSTQNSIRMVSRIGLSLPMVYTAVGKAIMAHLSDTEIKKIWKATDIVRKTEKTITDFDAFMDEIGKVRMLGFAADREENENGVCCVAAALPDIYGEYAYAFSVSAPATRMNEQKIEETAEMVLSIQNRIINALE